LILLLLPQLLFISLLSLIKLSFCFDHLLLKELLIKGLNLLQLQRGMLYFPLEYEVQAQNHPLNQIIFIYSQLKLKLELFLQESMVLFLQPDFFE